METTRSVAVLEGLDPIRLRPLMYIGDVGVHGLHWLVRELLACAHRPTKLFVTVEPTSLCINTDATPVRVTPRKPDCVPFLVELCSRFPVPIDEPASVAPTEYLDTSASHVVFRPTTQSPIAFALANAVSKSFVIASRSAHRATTARFSAGRLLSAPDLTDTPERDGVSVRFDPDPSIFGDTIFRFELICEITRDASFVRKVPSTVVDLPTNATFSCDPRAG